MRIALATFGVNEFAVLHAACVQAGHTPVGYVCCRSMQPAGRVDDSAIALTGRLLEAIPPGMDLLLPGTAEGLAELQTLSIGDNQLAELPEAIGDLACLSDLSLYDNQLRDLPRSLARLPLTFLHLGDRPAAPAQGTDALVLERRGAARRAVRSPAAARAAHPRQPAARRDDREAEGGAP